MREENRPVCCPVCGGLSAADDGTCGDDECSERWDFVQAEMSSCDAGEGEDLHENGGRCYWCGGDGWVECDDRIQCTSVHNIYDECQCGSCGGSGLAKDMTIW